MADTEPHTPLTLCPECGYDLRGLSTHRCPECGGEFDPERIARQPAHSVHMWLQSGYWVARAMSVLRICRAPGTALGSGISLEIGFPRIAGRLVGWAILWHLTVASGLLVLGMLLGLALRTWSATSLHENVLYFLHNASTLAFNVGLWMLVCFLCSAVILHRHLRETTRWRVYDIAAFLFALSAAGEASRRILHFVLCLPFVFLSVHYDPWRLTGAVGYALFAVLAWIAFRRTSMRSARVLLGMLLAIVSVIWLLEGEAFRVWLKWIERPLLSVLGVA